MRKLTATILVSILLGGLVLSCSGDKGLQSEPVTVADESLAGLTCEGQDNGIVGVGTVGGIAVTKSNRAGVGTFPNIVGSYWMYDVIDTVSGEEIEVSVTIT